jgi:Xaa-Pro aminopeptidase
MFEQSGADSAWLFFAPPIMSRNSDVNHPFRQESNFYYATGFDQAHSIAVLTWDPEQKKDVFHLFLQPRDPKIELWEGEMYGLERAKQWFGADHAYDIASFQKEAPALLKKAQSVYYHFGIHPQQDQEAIEVLGKAKKLGGRTGKTFPTVMDPNEIMGKMRQIKDEHEINLMREAGKASAQAHKQIIETIQPGINERVISGQIDAEFRRNGCDRNGYPSIVASGKNATCLHYNTNDQTCKDGDLMLLDAGGEYQYYTADITRTYPVGRSFSQEQKALYNIVLEAQLACVDGVKPGVTMVALQNKAIEILTQGLIDLGLLEGTVADYLKEERYKNYYPHGLGHFIGLDVHDVGPYLDDQGEPIKLQSGMIVTIEPGIYIQPDDQTFPEAYRGIGIRIEDDVLVTDQGHENLTKDVPKTVEDIESLRQGSN